MKHKPFALLALACCALFLFAGCAAWFETPAPTATPGQPVETASPAPATTPVDLLTSPALTPSSVENDAALSAYFSENYNLGYAEAAYVDLTHDGNNELVVVEMLGEDLETPLILSSVTDSISFLSGRMRVFSVIDGAVSQIFERQNHYAHVGWMQIYLYTDETGAYLFDYNPSMFQGYADYIYTLFSLDAKGEAVVKDSNSFSFVSEDGGFVSADGSGKDVSADVTAFEALAQAYVEKSQPLLVYFETLDGQVLFDYLNRENYMHS